MRPENVLVAMILVLFCASIVQADAKYSNRQAYWLPSPVTIISHRIYADLRIDPGQGAVTPVCLP